MERNNRRDFGKLVKAKHDDIEEVIINNCRMGQCSYSAIYRSYLRKGKRKKNLLFYFMM